MAEIHQVLWSLAVHAAVHHDAVLVRYFTRINFLVRVRVRVTLGLAMLLIVSATS